MYKKYTISEIGEIVSGATPKTTVSANFGGDIPWITPADLSGYSKKYISHGARNLTMQGYNSCSTQLMPPGSVLLSSRAPIGYVAIAKNKICTNQGFKSIVPKEIIDSEFLYYQLKYLRNVLQDLGSGTTFKELSAKKLSSVQVVVPPIEVQHAIVSKIEELFSRLDASVAELQTAKEKLKIYRQAVLKEALSSKEGWHKYHFSDLMEGVRNGYGKKPDDAGKYRILRISSVRPGKVDLSDYRTNQAPFDKNDLIAENDLLFTRYNGSLEYVGVCACVPQLQENYAYPDKIIKCTPKLKNKYHSKFIQYCMNQGQVREYIRSKIKTTSGQKGIAGSDIKKAVLWLPELSVQEIIVKKIDVEMSVCDSIEQAIDASLQQAESLRQSILEQAFEGNL